MKGDAFLFGGGDVLRLADSGICEPWLWSGTDLATCVRVMLATFESIDQ